PHTEEVHDDTLPILLLVEDNTDLITLLTDTFKNEYKVLTANNGEEGINTALEMVPDIIVSDVMMPIKDGVELTKTLKKDERTSHIPIVLLTAKAGDENKLIGIDVGADDYMTKPFNQKILVSKVENLIALRKKLRSRYSQEVILKPKDIAISSVDEQFLEKVQKVLDQNLVESSFTIDAFSEAVHMSRMQLHRKLKALTGLSASEFVRSQRLKLAASILKKSDINISEVGYRVGFNDPAYFAKCFKEAYNCTPSQFVNQ
ncbi:response regulator transcription factor, partial [Muriicola sp.]|uniref:response regulator transcription factor n=1 Tax=Muriicola sp. TaxID=2020856 RepID=UPI003C7414B7